MSYLYQRGDVTVDESFARFGSKSFAINKINSVEVRSQTKPASQMWALVGIVGLLVLIGADWSVGRIIAGLVLGGIAYLMWKAAKPETKHQLYLMTSSSEAQAYETMDREDIHELRTAIEQAMAKSH